MAIFNWTAQALSRSDGRSAVAAAAYRAGIYLRDDRTGLAHDFTKRRGLRAEIVLPAGVVPPIANAPKWPHELRSRLWNAAEGAERRINSVVAREIVIALPHELGEAERVVLGQGYAQWLADRYRIAVDIAWHPPSADGDQRNHHIHLQITTREVGDAFAFGVKTRILDAAGTGGLEFTIMRTEWAGRANAALEAASIDARIDARSLVDRGIDREPNVHLGPMRTNMIRAEEKRIAAIDAEIAALEAKIQALKAEEAVEAKAEEARRMPTVVIIEERDLGPSGPYRTLAPTPFGAWMEPVKGPEGAIPAPMTAKPSAPETETSAVPATLARVEPVISPAAGARSNMLSDDELEAVVGDAAMDEALRQNQIHAAAATAKRKADAEAQDEAETKAKKKGTRPRQAAISVGSAPVKRPYLQNESKPKRDYDQENLPPLRMPDQAEPEEEDGKPKRKRSKKSLLPVGPKMPTMMRSRTRTVSRSNTRSRGRGGPSR